MELSKEHKEKFKGFLEALKEDAEHLIVAHFRVLWDTVEEAEINIKLTLESGKEIDIVDWDIKILSSKK